MNTALLLIDLQNDYFPGGRNPLEGSPAAVRQARLLLDAFRSHALPLVHIQHISLSPTASFFLPDTPGAQIHPEVQPVPGETVFQKHHPNSFRDTPLLEHLHQLSIERLVICGMMTHMCVDATTRAAHDFGFECWVAQDACATKTLSFAGQTVPAGQVHYAFLAALQAAYARVLTVAEILAQLTEQ
jgi:nicotinamidase-related amidase